MCAVAGHSVPRPACSALFEQWKHRQAELRVTLTMSSLKVHECRMSVIECEKRAANTSDADARQHYSAMAIQWETLALQIERLENEMEELKGRQNAK
jgi:hypothetical protein